MALAKPSSLSPSSYGIIRHRPPFEYLFVVWDNSNAITHIELFAGKFATLNASKYENSLQHDNSSPFFLEIARQFGEYFANERREFTLPYNLSNYSEFYQQVWNELLKIPFGETRSYKEIAQAIGRPKAVRAIGQANRANPLPLLIPCHRVIGSNGHLVGYAGAHLSFKSFLLSLEGLSLSADSSFVSPSNREIINQKINLEGVNEGINEGINEGGEGEEAVGDKRKKKFVNKRSIDKKLKLK